MDFLAIPPALEARGEVPAPPSKSATNRALILAALSETPVEIVRPLHSADTRVLTRCLETLGVEIHPTAEGLRVRGPIRGREDEEVTLDVGDSGTAARFLAAVTAATPGTYRLTGSARMRERPMRELVEALRAAGAEVTTRAGDDRLPLVIRGGALRGGVISVDASRSSQFVSALLLAAVAVEGGLEVRPVGPVPSSPYVEATRDTLSAFGHAVSAGETIRVIPGSPAPARYRIPGDYSSALPLLAAAGVLGGEVAVTGLVWPSRDADARALEVLESMGVAIRGDGEAVRATSDGRLRSVDATLTDSPDAVPALAAVSLFAKGRSRIGGISHLRWKESDRIGALAALLSAAGGRVMPEEDALVIDGISRTEGPCRLPTASDHRIVMAAALIAMRISGVLVEGPRHVGKSYPGFFSDLESLLVRR